MAKKADLSIPSTTPPLLAEAGVGIYTIESLAEALGIHVRTVREAIQSGELKAFIPFGKQPDKTGPGLGYRIRQQDAMRWYFGE